MLDPFHIGGVDLDVERAEGLVKAVARPGAD